jgi:hypothetical protein
MASMLCLVAPQCTSACLLASHRDVSTSLCMRTQSSLTFLPQSLFFFLPFPFLPLYFTLFCHHFRETLDGSKENYVFNSLNHFNSTFSNKVMLKQTEKLK